MNSLSVGLRHGGHVQSITHLRHAQDHAGIDILSLQYSSVSSTCRLAKALTVVIMIEVYSSLTDNKPARALLSWLPRRLHRNALAHRKRNRSSKTREPCTEEAEQNWLGQRRNPRQLHAQNLRRT